MVKSFTRRFQAAHCVWVHLLSGKASPCLGRDGELRVNDYYELLYEAAAKAFLLLDYALHSIYLATMLPRSE